MRGWGQWLGSGKQELKTQGDDSSVVGEHTRRQLFGCVFSVLGTMELAARVLLPTGMTRGSGGTRASQSLFNPSQ